MWEEPRTQGSLSLGEGRQPCGGLYRCAIGRQEPRTRRMKEGSSVEVLRYFFFSVYLEILLCVASEMTKLWISLLRRRGETASNILKCLNSVSQVVETFGEVVEPLRCVVWLQKVGPSLASNLVSAPVSLRYEQTAWRPCCHSCQAPSLRGVL